MVGYSTGTTLAPPPPTVIWNNSGTAPTCVKYIQPQYSIQTLSDSTATFIPTPGYIEYVSNAAAQLVTNQVYKLVDTNSANGGWGWSCPVWKNAGFTTVATGCTGTGYWQRVEYLPQILLSPRDRLREILRSRHAPAIVLRGEPIKLPADHREQRARETLRMMLGEEKYRRFLTRGFVAIRAKSGLIYRLFPGYRQVEVYKLGALIEKLCIVLRGDFPPTDWLIMRYLLVLNDETDFRRRANLNRVGAFARVEPLPFPAQVDRGQSLMDIFAELRKAGSQVKAAANSWYAPV